VLGNEDPAHEPSHGAGLLAFLSRKNSKKIMAYPQSVRGASDSRGFRRGSENFSVLWSAHPWRCTASQGLKNNAMIQGLVTLA
jgi:hypothetical protein